jgi:hypothetical protein
MRIISTIGFALLTGLAMAQSQDPVPSPPVTTGAVGLSWAADSGNTATVYVGTTFYVSAASSAPRTYLTVMPYRCGIGTLVEYTYGNPISRFKMLKAGTCQIVMQTPKRNFDLKVTAVGLPAGMVLNTALPGPVFYWP